MWGWFREKHVKIKRDLFPARGWNRRSVWDIAAHNGRKEILEILWGWGREVYVNLEDDLFLAKGYGGLTAWDMAAKDGKKIF
jgi:hypothetical protein